MRQPCLDCSGTFTFRSSATLQLYGKYNDSVRALNIAATAPLIPSYRTVPGTDDLSNTCDFLYIPFNQLTVRG